MDYKTLLEKYMQHVVDCEGVTFTIMLPNDPHSGITFTDNEVIELQRIAAQTN